MNCWIAIKRYDSTGDYSLVNHVEMVRGSLLSACRAMIKKYASLSFSLELMTSDASTK